MIERPLVARLLPGALVVTLRHPPSEALVLESLHPILVLVRREPRRRGGVVPSGRVVHPVAGPVTRSVPRPIARMIPGARRRTVPTPRLVARGKRVGFRRGCDAEGGRERDRQREGCPKFHEVQRAPKRLGGVTKSYLSPPPSHAGRRTVSPLEVVAAATRGSSYSPTCTADRRVADAQISIVNTARQAPGPSAGSGRQWAGSRNARCGGG
jgi:hypothetical protein